MFVEGSISFSHQSRPKGGRRVPHSPPRRPLHHPWSTRTREARCTRYTVRLRRPGAKRYCVELVLTEENQRPPPPNSPLLRSIPSQAGTLLLHYRLTVRAHAVRCRLVWPDRGRSNPPPLWTAQSPLTRGKKRRKRRASTRNVREGSMAKWGCHVVDWKPRSAVSSRFFFSFLPANTLFYSARYCGAWHAWPRPSASWLGAGNLAVGTVPHLTWQSSRPCSRAVRCLCSCCLLLIKNAQSTTQVGGGGGGKSRVVRSACGTRICGWWPGLPPLEHCHIDGALIVVGRSTPGTPDHCPCLPSDELTGPRRQGHEPIS